MIIRLSVETRTQDTQKNLVHRPLHANTRTPLFDNGQETDQFESKNRNRPTAAAVDGSTVSRRLIAEFRSRSSAHSGHPLPSNRYLINRTARGTLWQSVRRYRDGNILVRMTRTTLANYRRPGFR